MQKCQCCPNPATVHVTEVLGEGKFDEHHLCETHYLQYQHDSGSKSSSKALTTDTGSELEDALYGQQACPDCGIKFVDFRNSHRLGCARDYQVFTNELTPLLENIHGETRHVGKTPRNYPKTKQAEAELVQLRQRLKRAIDREDYEEAARVRDQIKTAEEA